MQELFNIKDNFSLEPALYVISTPIGNIKDITIRALEIFNNVDIIFCEDTRVTNKLLNLLSIKNKKLFIYNDHNTEIDRKKIIDFIKDGMSVGLCSDAGTPLISDPGYKIVFECQKNNIKVVPIPGVSSVITALSVSSLPTDSFSFYGFLPQKKNERTSLLEELKYRKETLVFFESAKRLLFSLDDIYNIFGNREACIARELTKAYETFKLENLSNLIDYYKINDNLIKGEIVILIRGFENNIDMNNFDSDLKNIIKKMKPKEAVNLIASEYNLDKKYVYKRFLELKGEENER